MTTSLDALHMTLMTGSVSEREKAVTTLQQLGGHAAVNLLQIALNDTSAHVRERADGALRRLGCPPPARTEEEEPPPKTTSTPTGYVYVLVNSAMPELLKIGCTDRTVRERIAELSAATGVPSRFVCAFYQPVADPLGAEACIHKELAAYRCARNKEFFQLESTQAILAIQKLFGNKTPN
jgi:hypothetical protein